MDLIGSSSDDSDDQPTPSGCDAHKALQWKTHANTCVPEAYSGKRLAHPDILEQAVHLYGKAISYLQCTCSCPESAQHNIDRAACLSNRARVRLRLGQYEQALRDAEHAVALCPFYWRGRDCVVQSHTGLKIKSAKARSKASAATACPHARAAAAAAAFSAALFAHVAMQSATVMARAAEVAVAALPKPESAQLRNTKKPRLVLCEVSTRAGPSSASEIQGRPRRGGSGNGSGRTGPTTRAQTSAFHSSAAPMLGASAGPSVKSVSQCARAEDHSDANLVTMVLQVNRPRDVHTRRGDVAMGSLVLGDHTGAYFKCTVWGYKTRWTKQRDTQDAAHDRRWVQAGDIVFLRRLKMKCYNGNREASTTASSTCTILWHKGSNMGCAASILRDLNIIGHDVHMTNHLTEVLRWAPAHFPELLNPTNGPEWRERASTERIPVGTGDLDLDVIPIRRVIAQDTTRSALGGMVHVCGRLLHYSTQTIRHVAPDCSREPSQGSSIGAQTMGCAVLSDGLSAGDEVPSLFWGNWALLLSRELADSRCGVDKQATYHFSYMAVRYSFEDESLALHSTHRTQISRLPTRGATSQSGVASPNSPIQRFDSFADISSVQLHDNLLDIPVSVLSIRTLSAPRQIIFPLPTEGTSRFSRASNAATRMCMLLEGMCRTCGGTFSGMQGRAPACRHEHAFAYCAVEILLQDQAQPPHNSIVSVHVSSDMVQDLMCNVPADDVAAALCASDEYGFLQGAHTPRGDSGSVNAGDPSEEAPDLAWDSAWGLHLLCSASNSPLVAQLHCTCQSDEHGALLHTGVQFFLRKLQLQLNYNYNYTY